MVQGKKENLNICHTDSIICNSVYCCKVAGWYRKGDTRLFRCTRFN